MRRPTVPAHGMTAAAGVQALQQAAGNRATTALLLQRQEAATGEEVAGETMQVRSRPDLLRALSLAGHGGLASVIEQGEAAPPPIDVPRLAPPIGPPEPEPIVLSFRLDPSAYDSVRPFSAQQLPEERPEGSELWVVYRNDGAGINPGGGTDQGPTAFLGFVFRTGKEEGLTAAKLSVIDMHTPPPIGGPDDPNRYEKHPIPPGMEARDTMYETRGDEGYRGITSVGFEYTFLNSGDFELKLLGDLGLDIARWGEAVQDAIHQTVDVAELPWPRRDPKLYADLRMGAIYTTPELFQFNLDTMTWRGHMEFSGMAGGGTHQAEGELGARLVVDTVMAHGPHGDVRYEFSAGALSRAFVRYGNRESPVAGMEGGVTASFTVDLGDYGFGLSGEHVKSSDPLKQSLLPAGETYAAAGLQPVSVNPMPGGGHAVGEAFFFVRFD